MQPCPQGAGGPALLEAYAAVPLTELATKTLSIGRFQRIRDDVACHSKVERLVLARGICFKHRAFMYCNALNETIQNLLDVLLDTMLDASQADFS